MKLIKWIWYRFCTTCKPNHSKTVRFAFPLIFATMALMGAAVVDSLDTSYVRIESSVSTVSAGQPFTVDVYAYAKEAVNAVDITLSYPSEKVQVTGIDIGESVITLWTEEPYAKNGVVYMQGGTYRRGFIGEHLIAQINMKALNTGIAAFSTDGIQFIKGDGSGELAPVTESDKADLSLYVVAGNSEDSANSDQPLTATAELIVVTDVDGDGRVGLNDLSAFMSAWTSGNRVFDFNNDGQMTFRDFGIILADSFFK